MNTDKHGFRLSKKLRKVLDCGSPLPLWARSFVVENRQRVGAVEDADANSFPFIFHPCLFVFIHG